MHINVIRDCFGSSLEHAIADISRPRYYRTKARIEQGIVGLADHIRCPFDGSKPTSPKIWRSSSENAVPPFKKGSLNKGEPVSAVSRYWLCVGQSGTMRNCFIRLCFSFEQEVCEVFIFTGCHYKLHGFTSSNHQYALYLIVTIL